MAVGVRSMTQVQWCWLSPWIKEHQANKKSPLYIVVSICYFRHSEGSDLASFILYVLFCRGRKRKKKPKEKRGTRGWWWFLRCISQDGRYPKTRSTLLTSCRIVTHGCICNDYRHAVGSQSQILCVHCTHVYIISMDKALEAHRDLPPE